MQARLVIATKDGDVREVNLTVPATLGRSRQASVSLVHTQISRVHCELFERNGVLFVRDLDSTNGTYVNQDRVSGETKIPSGATLKLGEVAARVIYGDQPDVTLTTNMTGDTLRSDPAEDTFAELGLQPLEELTEIEMVDVDEDPPKAAKEKAPAKATAGSDAEATEKDTADGLKKQEDDDLDDFFNSLM
ncbi:MAG: FHA domain-containing protein [Planctomycetota bacterium]|nr:FHA domain-containing protein [Planctomycetota bacterium]